MAYVSAIRCFTRGSLLMNKQGPPQLVACSPTFHSSASIGKELVCGKASTDANCKSGTENASLVQNLATMGVDVRMVRQRQPGVLRKAFTNETGLAHFLQSKGASQGTVARIISRYPRSITRTGAHLEERWNLWNSIFKKNSEIVHILERSPESFFRSSDNSNLEKNIVFLRSLGLDFKDLHRLLSTAPRTFSNSVELNRQMIELLRGVCVSLGGDQPEEFVKAVISRNSYILIRSTKRVTTNIDFLQAALELSDAKLLSLLQGQGAETLGMSNECLKRNFKSAEQKLISLGCLKSDVIKLVIKYASALFVSPTNLNNKLDCLIGGGLDITDIIERPSILDFSIQNMKRRLAELQQIDYDFKMNGVSILGYSQKRFEAKLKRLCKFPEE